MRVHRLAVASVVLVVGAAVGFNPQDHRLEPEAVTLDDISDDARTLTVAYPDEPCAGHLEAPRVRETDGSVRITVPHYDDPPYRRYPTCNMRLVIAERGIRLARPLGRRRLEQPAGAVRSATPDDLLVPSSPTARCRRLEGLPAATPVLQVPRMAGALRRCRRPIPASIRALAPLGRPAGAQDRIPHGDRESLERQRFVVRQGLARGARMADTRITVVPGPRGTCASFRGRPRMTQLVCDRNPVVERDGLFTENLCAADRPPKRVRVRGVAPPGVRFVRLRRDDRTLATARVVDGLYAIEADRPRALWLGAARVGIDWEYFCVDRS